MHLIDTKKTQITRKKLQITRNNLHRHIKLNLMHNMLTKIKHLLTFLMNKSGKKADKSPFAACPAKSFLLTTGIQVYDRLRNKSIYGNFHTGNPSCIN